MTLQVDSEFCSAVILLHRWQNQLEQTKPPQMFAAFHIKYLEYIIDICAAVIMMYRWIC